ncbi:hypothetical protein EG68_09864 [Paragonimus skrjabini miyazakii]|uniref:Palmitoyltransferase n=1 Tax=Paragonimus skrjabini miyazakii TaxID=59628 RepID=A0A8S9YA92_9TREM|nr:hypothetical protein EG68_09864 [Paragonimus skrjabini miyazakii]
MTIQQIWRVAHIHTWKSTELTWLILNIPSWICFFYTRYKDPGYLAKDTTDYNSVLRAARYATPRDCVEPVIINRQSDICDTPSLTSISDDMRRIKHALSSLCHTCRCVRTTRSKHCSKCNRCVAVFDHHCPMTDSCVGKGNRAWFFSLCGLTCLMSTMMAYLLWKQKSYQLPWFWLVCFKLLLFSIWTSSTCTFLNVLYSASKNLTTNESLNWRRYSYLKGESSAKPSNPFDRGLFMNLSEYFGLRREQDVTLNAYGETYGIDV